MIAVFAVLGGGPLSVDNTIRQSYFQYRWPRLRAAAPSVPLVACVFQTSLWGPIAGHWESQSYSRVTAPLSAREVRFGVLIDGPSEREKAFTCVLTLSSMHPPQCTCDGLTLTVAPQRDLT